MTPTKRLLAVDGNSLIHRSYHAMAGSGLRIADGRPSWAVKGFLSQTLQTLDLLSADGLIVGFDDSGNSSRKARWPHYKATRSAKPADLAPQIDLAIEFLTAAGIHVVVPDGLEADDVLASAATAAQAAGWTCTILTSDRDAFALVDQNTTVLRLLNGGVAGSPLLTPVSLFALTGVHGGQYREYAAMRGDSSDNLTGMNGIGEKTAAKLLAEFGTVAAALADVDGGGAAVAAALGKAAVAKLANPDNRAAFEQNIAIMTMHADLDLGLGLADAGAGTLPLDPDRLAGALDAIEMVTLRRKALNVLCGERTAPAIPQPPAEYALIPPEQDEPGYPPPASPYYPAAVAPARAPMPVTASAMPGSKVAKPSVWDDLLF